MSAPMSKRPHPLPFSPVCGGAWGWLILPLALAACGGPATDQEPFGNAQAVEPVADARIACAPDGAADFTRTCTIERTGDTVTVRNPDGGFHRLAIAADGSVRAADGAEPAQVTTRGAETVEISIGGDRYRLPDAP